jgi:O-antigen/teichoic acid export membrane protein
MSSSHRQIFRSSAITGGASIISMVIGIINVKVIAVLLGPVGVGLVGLYQNIVGVASTIAGCGLSRSGVRQLAATNGEAETLAIVRRALWLGNLLLGIFGMACLWLLRDPIAQLVFGTIEHSSSVGWLSLSVFFTLVTGSQTALLQGLRRIGDIAQVTVSSSIAASVVGVTAVYMLKEDGVIWFIVIAPAVSILSASYFAARLPRLHLPYEWSTIQQQWLVMLKIGLPLMAATLVTLITQLIVRSMILKDIGLDASGYFQAAWSVSMTYIGFVLGAMTTDYFPRLTESIGNREQAKRLVNEQAEMALLFAGPLIILMITLAPWLIRLLYSDGFEPAADILRWQALGDILKVASFPMGFILAATGRSNLTFLAEACWSITYISFVSIGMPIFGVISSGVGFLFAYAVLFIFVSVAAWKLLGYRPSNRIYIYMTVLAIVSLLVVLSSNYLLPHIYVPLGLLATLIVASYSLLRLDGLLDLRSIIWKLLRK